MDPVSDLDPELELDAEPDPDQVLSSVTDSVMKEFKNKAIYMSPPPKKQQEIKLKKISFGKLKLKFREIKMIKNVFECSFKSETSIYQ